MSTYDDHKFWNNAKSHSITNIKYSRNLLTVFNPLMIGDP